MVSAALPLILEALPDATLVIEASGRIVQMNAAADRLFGAAEGALVGQSIEQLLAEPDRALAEP